MYVNHGRINNQTAAYLISLWIKNIERIQYVGYYNDKKGTFKIYPRCIVTPGDYAPELFDKRELSVHEVIKGY